MKPRLIKINLLWFCLSKDRLGGLGFTPREAYAEWVKRNAPKAIKQGE